MSREKQTKTGIYLDHAATTPPPPEVVEAVSACLRDVPGNPAALHASGRAAKEAVETARAQVAALLGADPEEIVFTSGGTESDNQALKGFARLAGGAGHLVVSAVEHHAVLEAAAFLEAGGWRVTRVPVDGTGTVDPDEVRRSLRPDTVLVSIMHANNEVGTVQPVGEIGRVAREAGVPLHTDAVQTYGHLPTDVNELNVDLLSLSGHKLYGPKGVGALYVRKGTRLASFMHGGGQEQGRRAGTLNVPGIVGLGVAARLASDLMEGEAVRLELLRERLLTGLSRSVGGVRLNGHPDRRLPNNTSISVTGVEGEAMLLALDLEGIYVSSGSACTSGEAHASHVLLAMGIPPEAAHGSLRITTGRSTGEGDVDRFLEVFPPIVERLRGISSPA